MQILEDNTFSFQHSFEQFLFNTAQQIYHQNNHFTSYIVLNEQNKVCMRWTIFHAQKKAQSPFKAPFGGIEFDNNITLPQLIEFIKTIQTKLIERGFESIQITCSPSCYDTTTSIILYNALQVINYQTLYTEINQHIPIENKFESHLHNSALRRLKRSTPLFQFSIEEKPNLNEIFELIVSNRTHQGHPLTISLDILISLHTKFKDSFITFTLRDKDRLIASAFGIIVNSKILYYYLPADHYQYKQHSPMLVIIQKMYEYCQSNGLEILDLGISTVKGNKNEGLIKFKHNLGAIESVKHTFLKQLI